MVRVIVDGARIILWYAVIVPLAVIGGLTWAALDWVTGGGR